MRLGVIAAGDGIRLKEEGIKEPKPLVKILEKTLLERILDLTEKYEFENCNIIINAKFKGDIEKSQVLYKYGGKKLNYIFKSTPSSLHSLYELKSYLSEGSFCLMTIDSIFNESEFENFIRIASTETGYDGFLAVTDFVDDEKPLWVRIDREDKILSFDSTKKDSRFVTGGIYFFREGIIEHTEKALSKNISRLRNFLQYLLEEGKNLKAVKFSKIIDVDHRNDLEEAEKFLKPVK
jgi:NDP-sugar pyrophosphorylase family protein